MTIVRWNIVDLIEDNGMRQMAIDLALRDRLLAGNIFPTLRFYRWRPAAISLGYHQRNHPSEWNDLIWQGEKIDIVKRPTGGRAVLHQGDLTYAIVLNNLQGKRTDIYRYISQFLIDGWQDLGFSLSYGDRRGEYIQKTNCFDLATSADLVLSDGYKLIGSAQSIVDGVVLQHGSIRLFPDAELSARVFGTPIAPPASLQTIAIEDVISALTRAAARHFQVEFQTIKVDLYSLDRTITLTPNPSPKEGEGSRKYRK
jgi:lipoate-protein ligase A